MVVCLDGGRAAEEAWLFVETSHLEGVVDGLMRVEFAAVGARIVPSFRALSGVGFTLAGESFFSSLDPRGAGSAALAIVFLALFRVFDWHG